MAFPSTLSITQTSFASDATAHLVAMPAVVDADDLLIILFSSDGTPTITNPTGWTQKLNNSASDGSVLVTCKDAVGNEDGTTVDVVTSVGEHAAAQVYRISAWGGDVVADVEISTSATGSSPNPDPDSLTPTWGAKDTLWIALAGLGTERAATAYPTNYTDGTSTLSGGAGGVGTRTAMHTARRQLNAVSDDPGTFTLEATAVWRAATLAIEPAEAPPPAEANTMMMTGVG
jgi:hypothetical protein